MLHYTTVLDIGKITSALFGTRAHRAGVFPRGQLHTAWAPDTKSKQATLGYGHSVPPESDRPTEYTPAMKDTGSLQQIFMALLCAKKGVESCEDTKAGVPQQVKLKARTHMRAHAHLWDHTVRTRYGYTMEYCAIFR